MAQAFRGIGRTAAWAAWPVEPAHASKLVREWVEKTARPAAIGRVRIRRERDRLVLAIPPEKVPPAGLRARLESAGPEVALEETAPGVFELRDPRGALEVVTLLDRDRVFAVVPVPPSGDPEYAYPALLPQGVSPPEGAASARLRAPWAILAALAWAAALFLRRRGV
jgi:hypothetical protein